MFEESKVKKTITLTEMEKRIDDFEASSALDETKVGSLVQKQSYNRKDVPIAFCRYSMEPIASKYNPDFADENKVSIIKNRVDLSRNGSGIPASVISNLGVIAEGPYFFNAKFLLQGLKKNNIKYVIAVGPHTEGSREKFQPYFLSNEELEELNFAPDEFQARGFSSAEITFQNFLSNYNKTPDFKIDGLESIKFYKLEKDPENIFYSIHIKSWIDFGDEINLPEKDTVALCMIFLSSFLNGESFAFHCSAGANRSVNLMLAYQLFKDILIGEITGKASIPIKMEEMLNLIRSERTHAAMESNQLVYTAKLVLILVSIFKKEFLNEEVISLLNQVSIPVNSGAPTLSNPKAEVEDSSTTDKVESSVKRWISEDEFASKTYPNRHMIFSSDTNTSTKEYKLNSLDVAIVADTAYVVLNNDDSFELEGYTSIQQCVNNLQLTMIDEHRTPQEFFKLLETNKIIEKEKISCNVYDKIQDIVRPIPLLEFK